MSDSDTENSDYDARSEEPVELFRAPDSPVMEFIPEYSKPTPEQIEPEPPENFELQKQKKRKNAKHGQNDENRPPLINENEGVKRRKIIKLPEGEIDANIADTLMNMPGSPENRENQAEQMELIRKGLIPNPAYRTYLLDMEREEFHEFLQKLLDKWDVFGERTYSYYQILDLAFANFDISEDTELTPKILEQRYSMLLADAIGTYRYIYANQIWADTPPVEEWRGFSYKTLVSKLMEVIYYCWYAIRNLYFAKQACRENYDSSMNDDSGKFKFAMFDFDSLQDNQQVLIYIESKLYENQYRRYRKSVYRKLYTEDGDFTYYWEKVDSIKNYIYSVINKNEAPKYWMLATRHANTIPQLATFLENAREDEFPDLDRCRHAYSFTNGVYITYYSDGKGGYRDYFYEYNAEPALPESVVCCKRFEKVFLNEYYNSFSDWYDIPTPNLQKILDFQLSGRDPDEIKEICQWVYCMIGRFMYEIRQLDNWQVTWVLQGQGGSGKSTIAEGVIQKLYEHDDIAVIPNNIEITFGLQNCWNRFIWLALDTKQGFYKNMDQGTFQSMASGETVTIPVKREETVQVLWKAPGLICTNDKIGYNDAAGSISRRLLVFPFDRKPPEAKKDTELIMKLENEMPAIIKKCNLAYHYFTKKYAKREIWAVLPKFYKIGRENLQEETDYVSAWFNNLNFEFGPEKYVPISVLQNKYAIWLNENKSDSKESHTLTKPKMINPINNLANEKEVPLTYVTHKERPEIKTWYYPRDPTLDSSKRKRITGNVIIGLDLRENCAFEMPDQIPTPAHN